MNIFNQIFPLWYFFANTPQKIIPNAVSWSREKIDQIFEKIRKSLLKKLRRLSSEQLKITIVSEDILWEKESALWITADADDLVEVYRSLDKVLSAVRESVDEVPDDRLRFYILSIYWSNIVIIPLLKGKFLKPVAWRININTLTDKNFYNDLKWWNLAQNQIPENALQRLNISSLDLRDIEVVETLVVKAATLYFLTGHMRDFLRLPELDEEGQYILENYAVKASDHLSETLTTLVNSIKEFYDKIKPLTAENSILNFKLVEIEEEFVEFINNVAPFVNFENPSEDDLQLTEKISLEYISDWAYSLEKAQSQALFIYLNWVSYIASPYYHQTS